MSSERAVRLVLDEGKTVARAAGDLDLTASALRTWVERARADRSKGRLGGLTTAEREKLARLRLLGAAPPLGRCSSPSPTITSAAWWERTRTT